MKPLALFLVVAAFVAPLSAQEIPNYPPPGLKLPHVVLIAMGGAIAAQAPDRMNLTDAEAKGVVRIDPAKWLHDLPDLWLIARVTTEDFRAPGADGIESVSSDQLYAVARRLQE